MNSMGSIKLLNKDKLLHNFSRCISWEEKYLYIIELGKQLPPLANEVRTSDNLISDCQSKVWIFLTTKDDGEVQLHGDSDAALVKGLIAIIFILYQGFTPKEIVSYDVRPFFNALELTQHLTLFRSQGLEAIIRNIRIQAAKY